MLLVQWFPGHMAKTRRLVYENIKLVDVVTELCDARIPASSRNPLFDGLAGNKPRLLVLGKEDLADTAATGLWLEYYNRSGQKSLALNMVRGTKTARKKLLQAIRSLAEPVLAKRVQRGIKKQTVRTMVVGIPNVGKSTLINFLAGKGAAETGDRPGVTRGKQWIRLEGEVELLDMPGLLWPKFEDRETGLKLAVTGAIRDEAVDGQELALWLIKWLAGNAPGRIRERYGIEESKDANLLLEEISRKRGFLQRGGKVDVEKGAAMLLDEFRAGKIGAFTLDALPGKL
ncbi:MAG: ribosome biogenesis GTPase YlqF [Peptococcaceae bacterium]|nr:ribosome biogenesis GTPase YlqF [Peptococcaceae bacterium]MDH7525684.1 ribosome biogenesis GTPase YlqF [Peptococcaceae bacterium]